MLSFNKYLSYLLTGSFSIVFAACYGAPMKLENPKLINAKNVENQAIPGLKVSVFENQEKIDVQYTDSIGVVELYFTQKENSDYKAIIEDVDGEENLGTFKSEEINLTNDSFFEVNLEEEK